jgi:hypothetical protein
VVIFIYFPVLIVVFAITQVISWTDDSVFHLYGRPLTDGVNWGGIAALVVASLALAAGSLVGFNRRDIAK